VKYLNSFKIFESRQSQTLWGFWLYNGEVSLVGLLDLPTAKITAKLLDDQLDPNGDDMYGISVDSMQRNGGDIWFDESEFIIQQGDNSDLTDFATPLHAKDLFDHPNQFIRLGGDYEINEPWLNLLDAIQKAYPHIKRSLLFKPGTFDSLNMKEPVSGWGSFPPPRWETVYKKIVQK